MIECESDDAIENLSFLVFLGKRCLLRWRLNIVRAAVTTLAGGVSGTNIAYFDGVGTNAGFSYPQGVTVNANGNVFVVDLRRRIRKISESGGTRIRRPSHFARLLCGH